MALVLQESDVRALLPMPDAIGLMTDALRAYSTGGVAQPVRLAMAVDPHAGYLALMPAHLRGGRGGPPQRQGQDESHVPSVGARRIGTNKTGASV